MIIKLSGATFTKYIGTVDASGTVTKKKVTLTITTTPDGATVKINGTVRNSIEVDYGTIVSYEVSMDGYVTKSGNITVMSTGNTLTQNITLRAVGSTEPEEPETGGGSGNTINVYHTPDTFTMQIMWYQDSFKTMAGGTLDKYGTRIYALDVSNFIGKTLTLTATQAVIPDAYYAFFVSNMLTALLPEALPNLTAGSSSTLSNDYIVSKHVVATEITDANLAGTVGATKVATDTISIQIPSGAKYFYFTNADDLQKTPASVTIN